MPRLRAGRGMARGSLNHRRRKRQRQFVRCLCVFSGGGTGWRDRRRLSLLDAMLERFDAPRIVIEGDEARVLSKQRAPGDGKVRFAEMAG